MIDALPPAAVRSDIPEEFIAKEDAWRIAMPTFREQANALAAAMNLNSTTDTSASSVLIGTGAKSFTVTAGKSFQPGMYLVIADTAAPSTNSMWGQVTSYSGTALVMNIISVLGSGTKAAWTISQSASTLGYTGGQSMSSYLNLARATVASAATTADIWAAAGNTIDWTGTTTCTGFPAAAQAGSSRKLIMASAGAAFTAGANMLIQGVPSGSTVTLAAKDVVTVEAITITQFQLVIDRYNGDAVSRLCPITASVGASAMTLTLNPCTLDFRSATLGSGTINPRAVSAAISTVISSGSTGGTTSGMPSRLAVLAIDNAGTVELAWCNANGAALLDESALISTTAEGGAGAADSASIIYSTTARSSVPFRIVGFVDSTQATAGTWATAPSTIQGAGGINSALKMMQMQQSATVSLSGTSVDFTAIPAWVRRITLSIAGLSSNGISIPMLQLGDAGGIENTGYSGAGGYIAGTGGGQQNSSGFMMYGVTGVATYTWHGAITLTKLDDATGTWVASGCGSSTDSAREWTVSGSKALSAGPLTQIRLTMVNGTDTFDAGTASILME